MALSDEEYTELKEGLYSAFRKSVKHCSKMAGASSAHNTAIAETARAIVELENHRDNRPEHLKTGYDTRI